MKRRYNGTPVGVQIGQQSIIEIPPREFRGRLTGFVFETDKCFILPGALSAVKEIKRFQDEYPGLDILVVGHADQVGTGEHNLKLSEQRAASVASFLQDKVGDWTKWYGDDNPARQRWGVREDQYMLNALGYYEGPIHGKYDASTGVALNAFRGSLNQGLDDDVRHHLIKKYMEIDETTLTAGTKIVTHGCGEYHPLQGVDSEQNRRVEVFFFEGPIEPAPPSKCPAGGCSQYFKWTKQLAEDFELPVRRDMRDVTVALRNYAGDLIERAPYRMRSGDSSKHGRAVNGQAILQVPLDAERCLVEWGRDEDKDLRPSDGEANFQLELYLHYDHGSPEEQARMRMHNIGYPDHRSFDENLRSFQREHELESTGILDDVTRGRLTSAHGTLSDSSLKRR